MHCNRRCRGAAWFRTTRRREPRVAAVQTLTVPMYRTTVRLYGTRRVLETIGYETSDKKLPPIEHQRAPPSDARSESVLSEKDCCHDEA